MTTKRARPQLPKLDKDAIAKRAQREVDAILADVAGPEQVANIAGELIQRYAEIADKSRAERDLAALHLLRNEKPPWRGVPAAMGVWGTYVSRKVQEVRPPVPHVENADKTLVEQSNITAYAEAIIEAARPRRDEAANMLRKLGWTSAAIAQMAYMSEGRVRQVGLGPKRRNEPEPVS